MAETQLKPKEILSKKCLEKNPTNIAKLGRTLRRLDYNNSNTIADDDIKKVIEKFDIKFTEEEYKELFGPFYADEQGEVYFTDFTISLRPEMTEKKTIAVMAVFNKLDAKSLGYVDANELRKKLDPAENKAIFNFLSTFEDKYVTDSRLTSDDFLNYYSGVSTTIRNDEEFAKKIKEDWLKQLVRKDSGKKNKK